MSPVPLFPLQSLPEEEQQRVLGEEKMLNINKKQATSPASKKPAQEGGKVGRGCGRAGGGGQDWASWQHHGPRPSAPGQGGSEKPKRPVSAMFIFSEEKRRQLQEERPELSESELTRLLARMWNDLSEKKKVRLPGGAPCPQRGCQGPLLPLAGRATSPLAASASLSHAVPGLGRGAGAQQPEGGKLSAERCGPGGGEPQAGDICTSPRLCLLAGAPELLRGERAPPGGGWKADARAIPAGQVQGPGGSAQGSVGEEARRGARGTGQAA